MEERFNISSMGFTMLETLVAVLLIAVMLAFALPNMIAFMPDYELERAAIRIESELKSARMKSMATGVPAEVVFDGDEQSFSVWSDLDGNGLTNATEMTTHGFDDAGGARFTSYFSDDGRFTPDGFFSVPGASLNLMYMIVTQPRTASYELMIVWPSGQISRYKY